jgi:cytochrome c-type biogenesis protein CcmH
MRRLTLVTTLLALALAASPGAAGAQQPRASLPDIEDEVMCPVCGTLLEFSDDTRVPQAERERALIRRLIAEGRSKEEIKDALVAEYGPEVLAVPEDEGFDLAAWVLPAAVLLVAAAAIVAGAIVLSRRGDQRVVPPELDPHERARLDRDISFYDP